MQVSSTYISVLRSGTISSASASAKPSEDFCVAGVKSQTIASSGAASSRIISKLSNQAAPVFSLLYPPTRANTVSSACSGPVRPYSSSGSHSPSVSVSSSE